jgi:hypothetical protein
MRKAASVLAAVAVAVAGVGVSGSPAHAGYLDAKPPSKIPYAAQSGHLDAAPQAGTCVIRIARSNRNGRTMGSVMKCGGRIVRVQSSDWGWTYWPEYSYQVGQTRVFVKRHGFSGVLHYGHAR